MLHLLFFPWSDCAPTLPLPARSVGGRWYRPTIARAATCDLYSVLCVIGCICRVPGKQGSFQRRKGSGHYRRLGGSNWASTTNLWPFGGCLTYHLVATWPRQIGRTISCHGLSTAGFRTICFAGWNTHRCTILFLPRLLFRFTENNGPLEVRKNSVNVERWISYAPRTY